eukprot:scaffold193745_cov25-Prasinocladus_malaysianus.AAC.1
MEKSSRTRRQRTETTAAANGGVCKRPRHRPQPMGFVMKVAAINFQFFPHRPININKAKPLTALER